MTDKSKTITLNIKDNGSYETILLEHPGIDIIEVPSILLAAITSILKKQGKTADEAARILVNCAGLISDKYEQFNV